MSDCISFTLIFLHFGIIHITSLVSLFIPFLFLIQRTRETLASGHFMSVINILMQLRKVCNHPNLFDPRPIQSPFITQPIVFSTASLVQDALEVSPMKVSMKGGLNSVTNFNLKEPFSCIQDLIENCTLSKQKKIYIFYVLSAVTFLCLTSLGWRAL